MARGSQEDDLVTSSGGCRSNKRSVRERDPLADSEQPDLGKSALLWWVKGGCGTRSRMKLAIEAKMDAAKPEEKRVALKKSGKDAISRVPLFAQDAAVQKGENLCHKRECNDKLARMCMDVSEKRRMRDGMDPQAKEVEDAKDTMFSLRCDIGIMDTRCWLPRFYRGDPCGDMLLSKDAIKQDLAVDLTDDEIFKLTHIVPGEHPDLGLGSSMQTFFTASEVITMVDANLGQAAVDAFKAKLWPDGLPGIADTRNEDLARLELRYPEAAVDACHLATELTEYEPDYFIPPHVRQARLPKVAVSDVIP